MPASTEARIRGACAGVEAAMTRASGPAPSTSSIFPASPPTSLATASALFGSASPTSISLTPGSRESTPAWRAPIRPAPSSPTFIRILSVLYAKQRAQLLLPDLQVAWGVRLGNEREASVDLGVDGFAACGFRGLLDANLTHRIGVLGYCGVHVAAYYRLGCLDGPVYPHEDSVALVRLKGLYRAEGHLVVGREDGVQVGVSLEEVLHGADGLEPVEIGGDFSDDLDVCAFYGLAHTGLPLVSRDRAWDARYKADGPLAVHLFLEVAPGFEAGVEVVRAYVGVLLLPARYVGIDQDHGHLLGGPLEDGLHQDGVGGRNHERVYLLGQKVLDYGYLLVDGQFPRWGLHEHGGVLFSAPRPRALLGRDPELLVKGLGHVADLHRPGQRGGRQLPAARRGE